MKMQLLKSKQPIFFASTLHRQEHLLWIVFASEDVVDLVIFPQLYEY